VCSRRRRVVLGLGLALAGLLGACASAPTPPAELETARAAVAALERRARAPDPRLAEAQGALAEAEQAYAREPRGSAVRDLAYVALRRAERASALLAAEEARREATRLEVARRLRLERARLEARLRRDEQRRQEQLLLRAQAEALERQRAQDRARAQEVLAALTTLGPLQRGSQRLLLALPDRWLFAQGKSSLRPTAEEQLQRLARALASLGGGSVLIAAAPPRPTPRALQLALRRADVIRGYLVARGVAPERIRCAAAGPEDGTQPLPPRRIAIVIERGQVAPGLEDPAGALFAP